MNPAVQAFIDATIEVASKVFNHQAESVLGPGRKADQAFVRHVAMYVAMVYGRMSSNEVAPYFGKDASTLRHAKRVVEDAMSVYPMEKSRVLAVAKEALDVAAFGSSSLRSMSPQDAAFTRSLVSVLSSPSHAALADKFRQGQQCLTYSPGGALALHPFYGKP